MKTRTYKRNRVFTTTTREEMGGVIERIEPLYRRLKKINEKCKTSSQNEKLSLMNDFADEKRKMIH
jgi:hypothetical protein